ncbi:MAG: GntR family transcriptional regulator [Hydrogenophaga sp.]|uniref:GntR family transcriptional regulator n=1 Tax=Hydrogenophaga sp. TaxID=1904254 RepID=UPI001E13BAC5|nr:GntR family transcriptional regulator [Hydrogenophaga sp.]MBX3608787.1 GntR family transcriptional regulator [Hydrogenophaga sp.]
MPNAADPAAPSKKPSARRAAQRVPELALDPRPAGALANADGDDVEARIYRAVFDSVMSQRLPPGTKLPEAALCELFEVNRGVVRKVLQKLAHDHIVQLRPNRGAIVAVPTREETQQIFEARRALEAAIVRLVAERATPADLKALRSQLHEESKVMHRPDQPAWARLASTYHLRLAELSGNPILHRYLVEIVSRCSLIVALHQPPGNAACEHDEHERIVDHIARGDADGAVALMDEHLRELERHLALERPTPRKDLAHLLGLG